MRTVFLVLLLAVTPALAPAQATPANPLDQIAWITGTWTADVKAPNGQGTTHVESQIGWSENHRAIRFVTYFTAAGKREAHYEGFYAWHPGKKKIGFWYTAANGNLTEGYMDVNGDNMDLDFNILSSSAAPQSFRSRIVRQGDEAYNWRLSTMDGKELMNVTYRRQK